MNKEDTLIKDIRIYQAVSKLSHPIADSTHDISKIAFYVLEVETKGGVIGQGYLLSFHYSPNAIEGALKDMKKFVLERDYHVYETAQVQKDYEIESEYFGIVGLQRWALATLNVAMWDAWARTMGQPIYRMFGCHRKPIPVYGSGGWISYSDEELVDEVVNYQKRGFTAVKSRQPGYGARYPQIKSRKRGNRPEHEDHDGRKPGYGCSVRDQADQQRGAPRNLLV